MPALDQLRVPPAWNLFWKMPALEKLLLGPKIRLLVLTVGIRTVEIDPRETWRVEQVHAEGGGRQATGLGHPGVRALTDKPGVHIQRESGPE